MEMTLRQIEGYLNAPKRDMKRLAITARQALLRVDELSAEVRRLQEKIAGLELATSEEVIVIHKDGYVEVFAESPRKTKIVNRPDLGRDREEEADQWVLKRLPLSHRLMMESDKRVRVAVGSTVCMDKYRFDHLQAEIETVKVLNQLGEASGLV